jgi:cytochrome c5
LVLILVLIGLIYTLSAGKFQAASSAGATDPQAVAQRLEPIGTVTLAGASDAPAAASAAQQTDTSAAGAAGASAGASGEDIYSKACAACHGSGVAGAPKLGDKAAWQPRIDKGIDALLSTAINGKGAMPPKGACMDCSEDELKSAIEYMISAVQ